MSAFRATWFALALGLLFLIPVVPTQNASTENPTTTIRPLGETAVVRILIPGSQAETLGDGVQIVQSYGSFIVARATADAVTRLAGRGLTVTPEDTFSLHVNGYVFDTRGSVTVPPELSAPAVVGGAGYYLVQFIGPIKQEWRWAVDGTAAKVVAYTANNVYVVRATAAQMAAIRAIPEVQWTGYYEPAFRIAPELLTTRGPVVVDIVVFDGEPVNAVVATLNKMGYRLVGHFSPDAGVLDFGAYSGFAKVRARLDASQLIPIARLRMVQFIQPYQQMHLTSYPEQWVLQSNTSTDLGAGSRTIFQQGIHGEGQTIAVADTGVDYDHSMFRHSQSVVTLGSGPTSIYNVTNFARRKVVRYLTMSQYVGADPWTTGYPDAIQDSPIGFCGGGHGTSTSSSATGDDTGITPASQEDGMALNAKLIMMDIGSVDQVNCQDILGFIPNDYQQMFGDGFAAGARIFSNSWGATSSAYTLEAGMVDRFMWNYPDALVLFANGNNPPNALVGSPATAKNLISVSGASAYSSRETMGAASRGPTTDGRRKPDLSTFFSTSGTSQVALSDGDLTSLNSGLTGFAGTSYSTPLAAGMAALARQYFTAGWYPRGQLGGVAIFPTGAMLKALMTASSVPMGSASACPGSDNRYPNIAQGWGRLWLDNGLYFSGESKKLFATWTSQQGIFTGDTISYKLRVASGAGNLRAMLAWSDYPALDNANPALVNNLDLDVFSPSSAEYKGNVQGTCASGQTTTGGTFDTRNNLEGVALNNPASGVWTFNVVGANVPLGPQRYTLVVVADLDRTYGLDEIDKTVYSEADTVNIQVTDSDAGAPVTVVASSDTEPAGEVVALAEPVGGGQLWRGSIDTAYGVPQPDGKLQVSCGDIITVTYNDNNPPHAAYMYARVDCDYPAIRNVRVIGITNSAATVTWQTDRPSDSTVYYGTTTGLELGSVTDTAFTLSHSVPLNNLQTSTLYYFDVASSRNGHATRDNNRGLHYTFKTGAKAEILLVLGDATFTQERLEMDRSALASASWTWNEWSVANAGGDPPLTTLQSYKAVLWEVGLEQYPPIPDATGNLLKTYIDNGGRLYLGGHDVGWAACDAASAFNTPSRCNFVRSILKFSYVRDPPYTSFGASPEEIGIAGDQISGAYTAGVYYFAPRDGAPADEGNPLSIGGTTDNVWRTSTGNTPSTDGFKWISSANNGTANPGCVFCGAPSRVAFFAFVFTGINYAAGVYFNAARTDIMNQTIIFLIGRSPPVVQVQYPNGGETISSSFTLQWQHTAVFVQDIWRSQDFGQSWFLWKPNIPAGNVTDLIDITNVAQWPDGNGYLMRVVVTDSGTPAFSAQDSSDSNFTIRRPGGDIVGPVVLAGSLRVSPNPLKQGQTATITATVDDTLTGNSNINASEFFLGTPGPNGTGTAMSAADGNFNSPTEPVTATMSVTQPPNTLVSICVHGQDAAAPTNNWGSYGGGNSTGGCLDVLVIPGGGSAPNAPTGVNAALIGATDGDVHITWQIPAGPPINKFQVYFATSYDPAATGYSLLQDNIAATATSWDHLSAGSGDANNYFYVICAVNTGGRNCSTEQSAKFTRSLTNAGWNIVSIPLALQDTSVPTALQTLNWRTTRTFVASAADPWKAAYARGNGELRTVSTGMALWVDIVSPKDFTIAGAVPTNVTLSLIGGWNFVGYSGFIPANANAAASFTGLGVTRLQGWVASSPYYLQNLTPATTTLEPGKGYWVYVTIPGTWTVTN